MFCPNCGNQMNDDAVFCSNCGWSKNGDNNKKGNFQLGNIANLFNKKIVILLVAILVIFAVFKFVTTFTAVGSFAKEMKTVEKQLEDGDYYSIIQNNIDYSDLSWTTPEDAKNNILRNLNGNNSIYGGLSVNTINSLLKGSELEKKLQKVNKEAEKALSLKYNVKKVDKDKVRLTLSFNLPRPTVLNNSKVGEKVQEVVTQFQGQYLSMFSGIYTGNYSQIINQLTNFDKPVIDVLSIYKSLPKENKQNFELYVDFYKQDGHWKYKLSEFENDAVRLSAPFMTYANEWNMSNDIVNNFMKRYGLNF